MDYKSAVNFIVNRRRDDLAAASAFFKRALARDPEFRVAELALRHAELEFARGNVAEAEVTELRRVRDEIVKKRGYGDKLNPPPHCPICGDTGKTRDGFCRCVKKLAIESRSDSVEFPLRSFDEIDYSLFLPGAKSFVEKTACWIICMHCTRIISLALMARAARTSGGIWMYFPRSRPTANARP